MLFKKGAMPTEVLMLPEKIYSLFNEFKCLQVIRHPNLVSQIEIKRMDEDLLEQKSVRVSEMSFSEKKYYFCSYNDVVGIVGGVWPPVPISLFKPWTWYANRIRPETVWEGIKRLGDLAKVVQYIVYEPPHQPGSIYLYKLPSNGMASIAEWRDMVLEKATRATEVSE